MHENKPSDISGGFSDAMKKALPDVDSADCFTR